MEGRRDIVLASCSSRARVEVGGLRGSKGSFSRARCQLGASLYLAGSYDVLC